MARLTSLVWSFQCHVVATSSSRSSNSSKVSASPSVLSPVKFGSGRFCWASMVIDRASSGVAAMLSAGTTASTCPWITCGMLGCSAVGVSGRCLLVGEVGAAQDEHTLPLSPETC